MFHMALPAPTATPLLETHTGQLAARTAAATPESFPLLISLCQMCYLQKMCLLSSLSSKHPKEKGDLRVSRDIMAKTNQQP